MKKVLLKTMLLLCALIVGSENVWGQSDKSAVYTSNVTLSTEGGTTASTATVVIGGNNYSGIKVGTGSAAGNMKMTIPAGTKYLHLHIAGWKGDNVTVSITPTTYSSTTSLSLTSDDGISGTGSTYTLSGTSNFTTNYYKVITFTNPLESNTEFTFANSAKSKRFVIWGVNSEEICATPTFSPSAGEVAKNTSVTISSATTGSTIYYTTNGSTPTLSSSHGDAGAGSATVTIDDSKTIKAIAVISGKANSLVGSASYTIAKSTNSITVEGGNTHNIALTGVSAVADYTLSANATHGTVTYNFKSATNLTKGIDFDFDDGYLLFYNTFKGIIVVTASVAEDEDYYEATQDITINCSGNLREPYYIFLSEEALSQGEVITVEDGENITTDGAITLETSDSSIASVDNDDKTITAEAKGSCNITITTAAGTYYSAGSTTFKLNVSSAKGAEDNPFTVAEVINGDADGKSAIFVKGYIVGVYKDNKFTNSDFSVESNLALADNPEETTASNIIPLELPSGDRRTALSVKTHPQYVGHAQILYKGNGQTYFSLNGVKGALNGTTVIGEYMKVSSLEWSTYSSVNALDFSDISEFDAYMVNDVTNSILDLSDKIEGDIPANTGILINGEANAHATVPVVANSLTDVSGNKLVAGSGSVVSANTNSGINYVLVSDGEKAVFRRIGETSATVPAGKAYLSLDSAPGAPMLIRIVEDENNTTAIETIEFAEQVTKFFKNGNLYILRDGITYDVTGRMVK